MTQPEFIPAARPLIGEEERSAVDAVLRSGMLAQGPEVAAFEREFADALVDGRHTAAVNSGTSGLHLGLLAAGIGPGDEVIVPSFTFAATANAVVLAGAEPVFADIDPDSFNLDPAAVESLVGPRTAAIMPVHLYGHPADMAGIQRIADDHSLAVFEDAAQAHAATIDGRPVGTFGAFAMFSLYPTKNMTSGEGGMVVSADADVDHRVRLLRNQGMEKQYQNELAGFNARMTDLHAAIGRAQLRKLAGWTADRRRNAARFDRELSGVVIPPVAEGVEHVYHQYTIRVPEDRDGFAKALREEYAIGSGVYYPVPVHRLPSFGRTDDLPETERAAREVLSLPVHPSLTEADLDRVVSAVNTLAKAGS
ncbi:DegT/DnrJ/EryC1/StrS family aminotransferase [Leifsonia shinshuensis]|uniref:DegT/DnrJ/EryC1/StrS family aminotransferase n=1 Tax=Leifsonia shinshuensis TaxID=150026 RepID=UPI00286688A6|nr:DegT/DnrJ/EryC1/StrS family aminotransferase [Leifsonia shinshuensis]MDR6973263.1 dTDP-4-amino-4,6-dideoxygalactose transaminase [Leifsonia shinshuensis]